MGGARTAVSRAELRRSLVFYCCLPQASSDACSTINCKLPPRTVNKSARADYFENESEKRKNTRLSKARDMLALLRWIAHICIFGNFHFRHRKWESLISGMSVIGEINYIIREFVCIVVGVLQITFQIAE